MSGSRRIVFSATAEMQRQRSDGHLVLGARLEEIDPVVRHGTRARHYAAAGGRPRKDLAELGSALDRHMARARYEVGDARAEHGFVPQGLLGVDEDGPALQRLGLPLGNR